MILIFKLVYDLVQIAGADLAQYDKNQLFKKQIAGLGIKPEPNQVLWDLRWYMKSSLSGSNTWKTKQKHNNYS